MSNDKKSIRIDSVFLLYSKTTVDTCFVYVDFFLEHHLSFKLSEYTLLRFYDDEW